MNNQKNEKSDIFLILGENIKEIREEQNITIKELSEKTGIRKEYLKKIEDGKAYGVGTSRIFIIATALKVKPHILVKGL